MVRSCFSAAAGQVLLVIARCCWSEDVSPLLLVRCCGASGQRSCFSAAAGKCGASGQELFLCCCL